MSRKIFKRKMYSSKHQIIQVMLCKRIIVNHSIISKDNMLQKKIIKLKR